MWGTAGGGGGAGQTQNWGFSAQQHQHAQVATEEEKWAALAHQWIQMKSCGAGLEQTLQPPLPVPQSQVNNNGTSNSHHQHGYGHSHSDSMDHIGEAPMDLDESVSGSHQNHLIQQPLQLQPQPPQFNANRQSLYTPDLITQIPPNPVISFSMAPGNSVQMRPQEPIHFMQHPHNQQMFQPAKIPSLMEQPFHHIQPQLPAVAQQQPSQRLLHPTYLEQAQQPTPPYHSPSPSHGKSNNRRKSKQHHHQSGYIESQAVTSSFEADQLNNYAYSADTTNSEMFEGIPRRSLPLWIREGLEKAEQEKRRLEQKEREDELRKQKEAERREQRQGLADREGPESDDENSRDGGFSQLQKGYEMPKPYIPEVQQAPLMSAMSKRGANDISSVLLGMEPNSKVSSLRRPKSPTMEELMEGMSEEDRVELAMTVVRRQLTMILLEVTTDEMKQIAKDCIARAKQKVSTVAAVQVRKTSALASLISGGPLGLGGYETDSGSEGGDDRTASDHEEEKRPESEDESSDNDDSEAELIGEIERKRLSFEFGENQLSGKALDSPKPKATTKPKSPIAETPRDKELSIRSSTESHLVVPISAPNLLLQAPTTVPRKSESPVKDHGDGGGSIRRTSSASEQHETSAHKNESSKSSHREREHERKHRSRSRERKKDDRGGRKSKSRSHSKERRRRTKSKSRSRERERDRNRKRKSKSRSRSKSRDRDHDRKNQKRSRTRSRSKDRDRKKKHSRRSKSRSRSRSDSTRRRERGRRRSASSSSSSSRDSRRKHKRHDKEEKDKGKDKDKRSKKKSRRSRSRSTSKSKSHRSKKSRHSRSTSPTSSRTTSN